MKKTYQGSCRCGNVRFEADIDLSANTRQCHCWICSRTKAWETLVEPEDFRLLAGEAELMEPPFGTPAGRYRACKTCGVASFGRGYRESSRESSRAVTAESTGGEYVFIAAACLHHVDDEPAPGLERREPRSRRTPGRSGSSASL